MLRVMGGTKSVHAVPAASLARQASAITRWAAKVGWALCLALASGACGSGTRPAAAQADARGPAPPADATATQAAPICPEPRPVALSLPQALQVPLGQSILVAATLCEDRTKIPCPPCPEDADCEQCMELDWIFCETPPIADYSLTLWALGLPGIELVVGRRYVISGERSDAQRIFARTVCEIVR